MLGRLVIVPSAIGCPPRRWIFSSVYRKKRRRSGNQEQSGERQRKYLNLSPWDKATLSMGRLILSNKMARTIAFFYTLFLHCLVFLVLYKTAWSESVGRDCAAYCAKKYSDHLHKFHENGENGAIWQE